ncbi:hypothetical protein FRC10_012149, partial [Ceratobasidium sp. 414]
YIPMFKPQAKREHWKMQCVYVRVSLPMAIEPRDVAIMDHQRRNAYLEVPLFITDQFRNGKFPPNVDQSACRRICEEEGYPLELQNPPYGHIDDEVGVGHDNDVGTDDSQPLGTGPGQSTPLDGPSQEGLFSEEELWDKDADVEPDPEYEHWIA